MTVKLMNQNIDQYAKATTFDYLCDKECRFTRSAKKLVRFIYEEVEKWIAEKGR